MENAVEALKMAAAVMVFVIALSISIMVFSQARVASEAVFYSSDETNYYQYTEELQTTDAIKKAQNRIVGMETIIPTLYKYYKENYTVVFNTANYNETDGSLSNIKPLKIYETKSKYKTNTGTILWSGYDWKKYGITDDKKSEICAFDLDDEIKRHEPWSGKVVDIKANLDAFIYGGTFNAPSGNRDANMQYSSFFKTYTGKRFVEQLGEYTYDKDESQNVSSSGTTIDVDGEIVNLVKEKKKRVITYTLIN